MNGAICIKLKPQQDFQICDCHDLTGVLEELGEQGTVMCGMAH